MSQQIAAKAIGSGLVFRFLADEVANTENKMAESFREVLHRRGFTSSEKSRGSIIVAIDNDRLPRDTLSPIVIHDIQPVGEDIGVAKIRPQPQNWRFEDELSRRSFLIRRGAENRGPEVEAAEGIDRCVIDFPTGHSVPANVNNWM